MKSVHQNSSSQNGHLKPRLYSSWELIRCGGWWKREIKDHSKALDRLFHWISGDVIKGNQFENKGYELSLRNVQSELWAKSRCSVKSSKSKSEA